MALTVKEKIETLEKGTKWITFTEPQKLFLLKMAETDDLLNSYRYAYPTTQHNGLIFAAQRLVQMVGIKEALAEIGWEQSRAAVSKKEALELLSKQLRKNDIAPLHLAKLLSVYAKMAGWDSKGGTPDEEVNMDKLITAIERKRRA